MSCNLLLQRRILSRTIMKLVSLRDNSSNVFKMHNPRLTTTLNDGFSPGGERSFHTCSFLLGSNKIMKMLKGGRSKKQWYETPPQRLPNTVSLFKPSKTRQEDTYRLRALNSIVFKAVSDLLTSYEVSSELPQLNVEISKVSLAADHSACRVYWKTCGTSEKDAHIQQVLDKSGRRIRYLLMSQQVLASVPAVVFIRDKQYAALNEIDELLKMADFGPNHDEPENVTKDLERSEVRPHVSDHQQLPASEGGRPVLFGIDHDALLKQVQEYKQQAREDPPRTTTPALTQQQVEAIAEFKKQKLIEKKKKKSKKNVDDDITPKAFLLARHRERTLEDLDDDDQHEDSQMRELMVEDHHRP